CSMARPQQGKERGDCGNATKLLSLASGPATGALPACQENQSFFKACNVNVEGSRMREIRTYGLTRGCWPVRLARRAGVYSTAPHPPSLPATARLGLVTAPLLPELLRAPTSVGLLPCKRGKVGRGLVFGRREGYHLTMALS